MLRLQVKMVAFDISGVLMAPPQWDPKLLGGFTVMRYLRNKGVGIAILTSNSYLTTRDLWSRLVSYGFELRENEVWPTTRVASLHLRQVFGKARCYVVGEEGLLRELEAHGHEVVNEWKDADAVVVGYVRDINMERIRGAVSAIRDGAYFVAASAVRWYWVPGEGPIVSPGFIVRLISHEAHREPVVVGKPSVIHYITVARHYGVDPEDALMVGDDVEADLLPAKAVGMRTALVASIDRMERMRQGIPRGVVDVVVDNVDQLVNLI